MTILDPLKMLVMEPLVIMLTLEVAFVFGVTFQFFILIPVVLETTYSFTVQQVGIAFIAAIVGALSAAAMSIGIDFTVPHWCTKNHDGTIPEEYRMLPAMVAGPLTFASLFWIAWTSKASVHFLVPIFGTLVYVWGVMAILVSKATDLLPLMSLTMLI